MREKYNLNISNRYAYVLAFIFFLAFWFSIFIGSGSVFSGYHLTDDHEAIRIHNDIKAQNNIIGVYKKWMKEDFTFRFKPLFVIWRVTEVSVFGDNFNMRLAYRGMLAVFTSFFLFLFFKKIGFSLLESILFPLLSFLGPQDTVWWAGGVNEAISMFFLSLTLIFMAYMIHAKKSRFIYGLLFALFAILTSLSKESFILMIPAIVFWMVLLYKENDGVSFFDSVKKNIWLIVILLLVMSAELFIVVKWFGTGGYGAHAGGLDGFNPLLYLKTAKDITLSISTIGLGLIIILSVLLVIYSSAEKGLYVRIKKFLGSFHYAIILSILIISPQIVIYARSGVFGRYILPLILGYSIFLLYIIKFLRTNDLQYFIKLPDRDLKMIYLSCGILGLFLLITGLVFLYNQDMSRLLFSVLGKSVPGNSTPKELIDILKPSILSIASGILIISFGWIIAKKRAGKLSVLHIVICLVVASISYKTMLTFADAYGFAMQGKDINSVFKSVERHTNDSDMVLIVADPGVTHNEAGWSIKVYLNQMLKRGNVYVYPMFVKDVDKIEMDRMAGGYERIFENKSFSNIEDKTDINYIIIFRELEQKFLISSKDWFNITHFTRNANDMSVTYYKKKHI
ncbi:MAG: hypothetical protein HZB79_01285 [Deltaproteobacteria bacterium]|nr:hypothetical protein [Deltaproteobacteria bacterium]